MFQAEVSYQLKLREWDYQKLADETGYKLSTIHAFLAPRSGRKTKEVAYKIAKVLGVQFNKEENHESDYKQSCVIRKKD